MTRNVADSDEGLGGERPSAAAPSGLPTKRLAAAIAHLSDPFVLTRRSARGGGYRIEYVNRALESITRRPLDDLRNLDLAEVLAELGCEGAAELVASAVEGRRAHLDDLGPPGRRGRRDFELTGAPVGDSGTSHAFFLRDVTEVSRASEGLSRDRRKLEKLVSERTTRLEQVHQQLRLSERLASIGTIAAGLCHDMNNLLMPVRGHLDAAESGGLTDDQIGNFASIREAIDFLQQLTNGLRLFALDPDDATATVGATDLAAWWRQLTPLLRRAIPDHIELEVDFPEDLPPVAVAPHRLTQAVLNLLINAGDAVGAHGRIRMSAVSTDDARFARLAVTDNGRGMSREAQKHALDPFYTTKTRRQSTGLGLSLVHGIVHAAGGRVDIQSTPGQGTTILLYLPVAVEDADQSVVTGPASVAVVDVDDPRIAACFESFLRSAGFEVERDGAGSLDTAAIWVTDASTRKLARVRPQIDANGSLRVIAYGRRDPKWDEIRATVVSRQAGLEGIREAIDQLILAAEQS